MTKHSLNAPSQKIIRSYSHDIDKLIQKIIHDCPLVDSKSISSNYSHGIKNKLILLLSEFGTTTRYQNINELSTKDMSTDPLKKWMEILIEIIEKEIPQYIKDKVSVEADFLYALVADSAFFMHFDFDRKLIPANNVFNHAQIREKAVARATRHIVQIIDSLRKAMQAIGHQANIVNMKKYPRIAIIPDFGDFFRGTLTYEGENLLKKKRWQAFS